MAQRNFPTNFYVKRPHTHRTAMLSRRKPVKIPIFTSPIEVSQQHRRRWWFLAATKKWWENQNMHEQVHLYINIKWYSPFAVTLLLFLRFAQRTIQHQRRRHINIFYLSWYSQAVGPPLISLYSSLLAPACVAPNRRTECAAQRSNVEFASFLLYCFDDTSFTCSQKSRMRSK